MADITRRSFLEHTLATAAAGLAAARVAQGASKKAPKGDAATDSEKTPKADRIRVAIVGLHISPA